MRRIKGHAAKSTQDRTLPKYSIAVAADLSGVPQQQLRRMEESGLITPARTEGNTRRYSDDDLEQLAQVAQLADAGINAAGIRYILGLGHDVRELRAEIAMLRQQVAALQASSASAESPTDAAPPHNLPAPPANTARARPANTPHSSLYRTRRNSPET